MNIIQTLEQEEIARLTAGKKIPEFRAGDTVNVLVNVIEGSRKRTQAYEGVVIAKRNRGLNSSFIVRKISSGEGVERTFQLYSPMIASIEVKRRGDVFTTCAAVPARPPASASCSSARTQTLPSNLAQQADFRVCRGCRPFEVDGLSFFQQKRMPLEVAASSSGKSAFCVN